MKRFASVVAVFLLLANFLGCGKNDAIYPVGNYAYNMPGSGGYGNPPSGVPPVSYPYQPPTGGCNTSTCFNPQMPSGYPSQYTIFLPMDNYFRYNQNSSYSYYWTSFWSQWQQVAPMYGYSPYAIGPFLSYCQNQWQGSQLQYVLNDFRYYFYPNVTSNSQYSYGGSPSQYWGGMMNFPYYNFNSSCGAGC